MKIEDEGYYNIFEILTDTREVIGVLFISLQPMPDLESELYDWIIYNFDKIEEKPWKN